MPGQGARGWVRVRMRESSVEGAACLGSYGEQRGDAGGCVCWDCTSAACAWAGIAHVWVLQLHVCGCCDCRFTQQLPVCGCTFVLKLRVRAVISHVPQLHHGCASMYVP